MEIGFSVGLVSFWYDLNIYAVDIHTISWFTSSIPYLQSRAHVLKEKILIKSFQFCKIQKLKILENKLWIQKLY